MAECDVSSILLPLQPDDAPGSRRDDVSLREPSIVRPEKHRAARTLSLRGGPTNSRHRSEEQAAPGVVESSGWLTSRPPRSLAPRRFSCERNGLTSRLAARDTVPPPVLASAVCSVRLQPDDRTDLGETVSRFARRHRQAGKTSRGSIAAAKPRSATFFVRTERPDFTARCARHRPAADTRGRTHGRPSALDCRPLPVITPRHGQEAAERARHLHEVHHARAPPGGLGRDDAAS
jgi:hypothetical protein